MFEGILKNYVFVAVLACTVLFQIVIIQFLGTFANTYPLNSQQWFITVLFGFLGMPIAAALKMIPVGSDWKRYLLNLEKFEQKTHFLFPIFLGSLPHEFELHFNHLDKLPKIWGKDNLVQQKLKIFPVYFYPSQKLPTNHFFFLFFFFFIFLKGSFIGHQFWIMKGPFS